LHVGKQTQGKAVKILVISNIYPPTYVGGYELGCRDAVEALRARGHDLLVLTSRFPDGISRVEGHVHRKLTMFLGRPEYWKVLIREVRNQIIFRSYCRKFRPDVVFFWKIADLSLSFVEIARQCRLYSCFYVFDTWIADWRNDRFVEFCEKVKRKFHIKLPRQSLGFRFRLDALRIENTLFASRYLQQVTEESIGAVQGAAILPWGIDISKYHPKTMYGSMKAASRLLYVGQIVPHKGVHIAIKALALARLLNNPELCLTIVGDTEQSPEYVDALREIIEETGVQTQVSFTGKVEHDHMPELYRQHDILIFSSLWDEPFGLTPLEALASGLAVIGTGTGGSAETLIDGCNALLYHPTDPSSCAAQIDRLVKDPLLLEKLVANGLERVHREYRLSDIAEKLEGHLKGIAGFVCHVKG
jgi:glycogen(starch) synthase